MEVHGSKHPVEPGLLRRLNWLLGFLVMALCLLMAHGWQPLRCTLSPSSIGGSGRVLEGVLYALLLLRVGRDWYSLMASSLASWEVAGGVCFGEVASLRRQSHALHQSLAQAQHALGRLETRLEALGATPQRPSRRCAAGDPTGMPSGAPLVPLSGWLLSLCALPFLPETL